MKQADLRDMFKMISKCVCTSNVEISREPLSSLLSNSSVKKMQENMKEDLMILNQQIKETSRMQYSSD
jgi:hypothetical protein